MLKILTGLIFWFQHFGFLLIISQKKPPVAGPKKYLRSYLGGYDDLNYPSRLVLSYPPSPQNAVLPLAVPPTPSPIRITNRDACISANTHYYVCAVFICLDSQKDPTLPAPPRISHLDLCHLDWTALLARVCACACLNFYLEIKKKLFANNFFICK